MEKKKNQRTPLFLIFFVSIILIVLIRTGILFRFKVLLPLVLAGFVAALWFLFKQWQTSNRKKARKNTPEGKIEERIEYCHTQIEKIDRELSTIQKDIEDLKQNLRSTNDTQNSAEGQQLLKAFNAELELRQAKRTFFKSCISKLEKLLHNYRISKNIAAKKNKLKALQEEHYEDLANMEALRSDVEMDVFLLDDIETLSLKTLESDSLENINHLRKELEEMTRDLNNND